MKKGSKGKKIFTYQTELYMPNESIFLGWLEIELNFHKYIFYEYGIELHFRSQKKKPIFVSYSDIIDVSFYSCFHYKFLESLKDYEPYWFLINSSEMKIRCVYSDEKTTDKLKDIFTKRGCKILDRKFKNLYGTFDISIEKYSFSEKGFKITFFDGSNKKYFWDNIISVSYDPFKIRFDEEYELSFHHSEAKFQYNFKKEYNKHVDKLEEELLKE